MTPPTPTFGRADATALTPRECEVLTEVLTGNPNKVIADVLGISQRTVEVHRSRIFQKMGVRNAVELAGAVYRRPAPAPVRLNEPDAASSACDDAHASSGGLPDRLHPRAG